MEDLLEVILEQEAHQAEDTLEEANQEADQPPPSPRFQYLLLLMFRPWEPYLESLVETGPNPLTLWKSCWDISDPTPESPDLTPQYEELPSPSPSSKGKKSLDGHATWEGGLTDSTQLMTTSCLSGSSSYMSLKDNLKTHSSNNEHNLT